MGRSIAALLIAASLAAHTSAQTPKGSSRIRGRVVAAATGRALSRATVRIQAIGNPQVRRTVMTDSNGQYEIPDLPAGRYSFSASHVGYLDQQFDQPRPLSRYRLLELAAGEQRDGIDFSLHRGGAVVGIIVDEFGDPLPGVRVEVMREIYGISGRRLIPESRTSGPPVTDDEGRYRVYGLLPGAYVVAATDDQPPTDAGGSMGYARTYYPGTTSEAEAQMVRVGLDENAAADFALVPARLSRISGVVRDSQGQPGAGIRVTLATSRGLYFETVGQTGAENDGSFRFDHVRPGEYVIHVRPRGGEPRLLPRVGEWAAVRVSVTGEDISDLTITTSSGFIASGRVAYEGSSGPMTIKSLRILSNPVDRSVQQMSYISTPENGLVDDIGRFRLAGVSGRVRLFAGGPLPAGWFFKRVLFKGTDITESGIDVTADIDGLEVVLTDRATTVSGTVRNAQGVSLNNYIITFFPVGGFSEFEKGRRLRTIRPDPDGMYRIRSLPPGEYLAAAVPVMSLPIGGEWEPAFLERVKPLATGFRLTEGQTFVLNLSLIE